MKSKFDGIVKVKKQELDQAEAVLVRAKKQVRNVEEMIEKVLMDILSLKVPKKGNFNQMQLQRQTLDMMRRQKQILNIELMDAKQKVENYQRLYEFANREFEKMTYLKDEEIAQKIKAMQKQEQKDMDEIALQLFAGRM